MQRANVLCADDDSLVRDAFTLFLGHLGLEVSCCTNGHECLDVYQASPDRFDLVMVNYDMPGMTGRDVVRKIQGIRESQRVALTSGYSRDEILGDAGAAEEVNFLPKPFTLPGLRRFLRRSLPLLGTTVHAVLAPGVFDRTWLKPLAAAADPSEVIAVSIFGDPDEALEEALKGYTRIIVWELEAGPPPPAVLERAEIEAIPIIFLAKSVPARELTAFGAILLENEAASRLRDLVLSAARGTLEPNRSRS